MFVQGNKEAKGKFRSIVLLGVLYFVCFVTITLPFSGNCEPRKFDLRGNDTRVTLRPLLRNIEP